MPTYPTIDYLPDLTATEISNATNLSFKPYTGTSNLTGWDFEASYSESGNYAILRDLFAVTLRKGATYDFASSSFFDPYVLLVYDNQGNAMAADSGKGTYGNDYVFGFVAPYDGTYYVSASWNQGMAPTNKFVFVAVFEDKDTIPTLTPTPATPTPTPVTPTPTPVLPPVPRLDAFENKVSGTPAIDTFRATAGVDVFDGLGSLDTAIYAGPRANYNITKGVLTSTVASKSLSQDIDRLVNVERVAFSDKTVSFEMTGVVPQAYRVYQAAFNRAPDEGGLGFWIAQMERGATLGSVAKGFTTSEEFLKMYGTNPSSTSLITGFYNNVLHRQPEKAGLDYWVNVLDTKADSVANVLANFSESPENQALVIGSIQLGVEFIPWTS